MAVKNFRRLDPNATYRIDGLPGNPPASGWRVTSTVRDLVWFTGPEPANQRVAVDLNRLYQVRPGHLHYVATT
jgi:hypothetical protein